MIDRVPEQLIRSSLSYLISTVVTHTNEKLDSSDEDKEILLNVIFNVLTNTLQPEYGLLFVEELSRLSGHLREIEARELKQEILDSMRGS